MFKYVVRLVRNGIGFDYEVMARTTYEAKETAERFYPDHKASYAKKKKCSIISNEGFRGSVGFAGPFFLILFFFHLDLNKNFKLNLFGKRN